MDDFQRIVLRAFETRGARRLTYGELRETTRIRRGLTRSLAVLRDSGVIHWELDPDGHVHDETTIVSLCTMVDLGYDLKLIILDPDAAKPVRNELTWQILVLGSDNLYLASEGFRMSAHGDPASYGLEVWLYNNVSSSIVDNAWPKIKEALAICYKEYTDRHVGVEA